MLTKRKIQLGAFAVMANGFLALTLLSPREAQANPCTAIQHCIGVCPTNLVAYCTASAPAGCTPTAEACAVGPPPVCGNLHFWVSCQYN